MPVDVPFYPEGHLRHTGQPVSEKRGRLLGGVVWQEHSVTECLMQGIACIWPGPGPPASIRSVDTIDNSMAWDGAGKGKP